MEEEINYLEDVYPKDLEPFGFIEHDYSEYETE